MTTVASFGGRSPLRGEMHFVYLLKCADNSIYVGCTSNLEDRLLRHAKGWIIATKDRLPFELVMYHVFSNKHSAYSYEKYLKSGSGRAFLKRHLI